MDKHTPGPWKTHKTGLARSGKPEFEIHWSEFGECVAEIVHGEPDARLIAAAPDLLAALIVAEAALNRIRCTSHTVPWEDTGPAVEQARAAIAKATGEATC